MLCVFMVKRQQILLVAHTKSSSDSTIQMLNKCILQTSIICKLNYILPFPFHPSRFRYAAVFILQHPLKWWWSLFQLNSKASSYVYRQTESRPFIVARAPRHGHLSFTFWAKFVVSSIFIVISCVLFRCIIYLVFVASFFFFFFCFTRSTFSFCNFFFLVGSMAFRPYFAWRRLVSSAIGFWMLLNVRPCAANFFFFATTFTNSDSWEFVPEFFFFSFLFSCFFGLALHLDVVVVCSVFKWIKLK